MTIVITEASGVRSKLTKPVLLARAAEWVAFSNKVFCSQDDSLSMMLNVRDNRTGAINANSFALVNTPPITACNGVDRLDGSPVENRRAAHLMQLRKTVSSGYRKFVHPC